jgi:WD40 repeat protein
MGSVTVLWDSRTDKAVMRCESSHGSQLTHHHLTSLAVHPDQPHRLVTGASDGRVTLYDLRVNAALQSHTSHSSLVWEVKYLPQQPDALLSCGEDGQLLLWHANTPVAPVHRLLTNIMGVNSFDIHPELQYLAGSLDQEAVVFSTQLAEKM